MKQTFDTNEMLFGILKAAPVAKVISGDVYVAERPDDSDDEDIVVNTIEVSQEYTPQTGVSNVNIHVSDIEIQIKGKKQRKANLPRLKELSAMVVQSLREAQIPGLEFVIANQTTIEEPARKQHFSNLRIEWNIH